ECGLLIRLQICGDFSHEIVVDRFQFLSCGSVRQSSNASGTSITPAAPAPTTLATTCATWPTLTASLGGNPVIEIANLLDCAFDDRSKGLFLITGQRDVGLGLQECFNLFHRIDGIDSRKYLSAAPTGTESWSAAALFLGECRCRGEKGRE